MIWRTIIFGAALVALSLINDQMHWLPPLTFAALAISVLLVVVAPRPAWVALLIAGLAAHSVRSVFLMVDFTHLDAVCLNGSAICSGSRPGWYATEDPFYSPEVTRFFLELPIVPAWLIVAGVLGWAIRCLSWRVAVAGALYAVAVWQMPFEAPIVLFAAAAAAIGPRRDAHYLTGIGILALVLIDQRGPWTLLVTIIAITVTLGLGIWAWVKKNGVNGAVALVSLASAALTPFLSAGVLLVASAIKQRTLAVVAVCALGAVAVGQTLVPRDEAQTFATLRAVPVDTSFTEEQSSPIWLIAGGVLLAGAAVAALYRHRHRRETDQANG
ncbi:hypothetical protein C8D88_105548 [Lentzea atacamensis]|uniref:Uncharacterized protein n=1 Tax=Lentzea atacamensis TaxID=531938 RepID=A0A316HZB5_9PSEU|nr:hypothetical protein [Lentzea atacamensis]PWK86499.1 hypothetical protein C8D88_105548 [Lentzea atacamensis]